MIDTKTLEKAEQETRMQERIDRLWDTKLTSAELLQMSFPEPIWIVPSIITEGLTILAGAPKVGKSWLTLSIASGVSVGGFCLGNIKVPENGVLYLALEDSPRRLQNRLNKLEALPSNKIHFLNAWFRGKQGIDALQEKLKDDDTIKLLIIDTLGKTRSLQKESSYDADYQEISQFKELADNLGISVLLVHHTRKAASNDFVDDVSGTLGIAGAADTVLILKRGRGQADGFLSVTGRDIEEKEFALSMDANIGWELLGDAEEYREGKDNQQIITLLKDSESSLSPKEIAETLGIKRQSLIVKLNRMEKNGVIKKAGYGKYTAFEGP